MPISVRVIQEKEFKTKMRGYDEIEVDDFLDEIAEEMDRLIRENGDLRKRASEISQQQVVVERPAPVQSSETSASVKSLENTLRDTLVMAQRTSEETIREAEKKASTIISNAEREASRLRGEAQDEVDALREEFFLLKQKTKDYVVSQHGIMSDLLQYFEKKSAELSYNIDQTGEEDTLASPEPPSAYKNMFDDDDDDSIGMLGSIGFGSESKPEFGEPQSNGDMGDTMVFKNPRR